MCGYFWGKLIGDFLPNEWLTLAAAAVAACIAAFLLVCLSATIKTGWAS